MYSFPSAVIDLVDLVPVIIDLSVETCLDHCSAFTKPQGVNPVSIKPDWMLTEHISSLRQAGIANPNSIKSCRTFLAEQDRLNASGIITRSHRALDKHAVFFTKFDIPMRPFDFQTLQPRTWLNDQIINFFMEMLVARSCALVSEGLRPRRSYFFNSFFMDKLEREGYNGIRRWSKNFDIFDMENIFFPINIRNYHWVLAIVDIVHHQLHFFCSQGKNVSKCLNIIFFNQQLHYVFFIRWGRFEIFEASFGLGC